MARSLLRWGVLGLLVLAVAVNPIRAEEDDVVDDDEYADVLRAHLVVRKSVQDELVVAGMNVTVTVDIYNAGQSTAGDVKLADTIPTEATLIAGTLEANLGKISIASHVKHSYTIVFNNGSLDVTLPPATVSYLAEPENNDVTAGESSTMPMYVMTPVQQIQRYALQAGAYASLGFARSQADWRNLAIVGGVVGTALGANWAVKKYKANSISRRRAAALRELEKSE